MMIIDDLSFSGEYPGVSSDPGAEAAAKAFEFWNKQARRRRAAEEAMDDIRTTRLARLISVANQLTDIERQVKGLWLSAENDAERMERLLEKVRDAESCADRCHRALGGELIGAAK